jgi:hypothetical protein
MDNGANKKKNKKMIIILIIVLIPVMLIVGGLILENQQEKVLKKLEGKWYDNTGAIMVEITSFGFCHVSFNLEAVKEQYGASNLSDDIIKAYTPTTSDCSYKLKNKKLTLNFNVKISATNTSDTYNWIFEYNNDYSELKRIDEDAGDNANFTKTKPEY